MMTGPSHKKIPRGATKAKAAPMAGRTKSAPPRKQLATKAARKSSSADCTPLFFSDGDEEETMAFCSPSLGLQTGPQVTAREIFGVDWTHFKAASGFYNMNV